MEGIKELRGEVTKDHIRRVWGLWIRACETMGNARNNSAAISILFNLLFLIKDAVAGAVFSRTALGK